MLSIARAVLLVTLFDVLMAQPPLDRYRAKKREFAALIQSRGCTTSNVDIASMGEQLAALASAAGLSNQGDGVILTQVRDAACDRERSGAMPAFESAIWAMTDARRLDPCSYSPLSDYSSVFNDPSYQQFNGKRYYDNGGKRRFEIYLDRTTEEAKRCFLDLIEATITGKPWTPRKPSSAR
jgi:hypothetical protein